jgi:hypothetical protein
MHRKSAENHPGNQGNYGRRRLLPPADPHLGDELQQSARSRERSKSRLLIDNPQGKPYLCVRCMENRRGVKTLADFIFTPLYNILK